MLRAVAGSLFQWIRGSGGAWAPRNRPWGRPTGAWSFSHSPWPKLSASFQCRKRSATAIDPRAIPAAEAQPGAWLPRSGREATAYGGDTVLSDSAISAELRHYLVSVCALA